MAPVTRCSHQRVTVQRVGDIWCKIGQGIVNTPQQLRTDIILNCCRYLTLHKILWWMVCKMGDRKNPLQSGGLWTMFCANKAKHLSSYLNSSWVPPTGCWLEPWMLNFNIGISTGFFCWMLSAHPLNSCVSRNCSFRPWASLTTILPPMVTPGKKKTPCELQLMGSGSGWILHHWMAEGGPS